MSARARASGVGGTVSVLLGILIGLFGLIFIVGGIDLAWLGGSWYYLLCGIVLLASGVLMTRGRLIGAWLFLFAWVATILWTVYEVGFDWWGWLPRDFGPTLIAIAVILCVPALRRRDTVQPIARGAV